MKGGQHVIFILEWLESKSRIARENKYNKEGMKVEAIDRKFQIAAVSLRSGKKYTQANAVLFLAKDELLPKLLDEYHRLCAEAKVDERQLLGIALLKERVIAYQRSNIKKVHLPDVEPGKEEKRVCKDNKV